MKQKQLEIILQTIPPPTTTNPTLEQYHTPAKIAADILYIALSHNDIYQKTIIDLGCGTGIFSIGAALLGAKTVTGIDIDPEIITQAQKNATKHNLPIQFFTTDITNITKKADTVIMNPPFGAQKANQHADRKFLELATTLSTVIYSLHLTKTIPFITKLLSSRNTQLTHTKKYQFPIKHQHQFHSKEIQYFDVTLIRATKK